MRYFTSFLFVLISLSPSFAQKEKKVQWYDWYDSASYFNGPKPIITGYGTLSDSLSLAYDGKTFFEYEGVYYVVNNLADYYLWFTRKYSFLFKEDIAIYEGLYYTGQSYRLAQYVSANYQGKKLPVKFRLPRN